MTTQEKPRNATHWSLRRMADAAEVSPFVVWKSWKAHGLKPHLNRTFKVSNDPRFAEKVEDIVGLYLDPPEHAVVQQWVARHKRVHVHCTPTSSSWLNMVERLFRDITENRLRRGVFRSVEALVQVGPHTKEMPQTPKTSGIGASFTDLRPSPSRPGAAGDPQARLRTRRPPPDAQRSRCGPAQRARAWSAGSNSQPRFRRCRACFRLGRLCELCAALPAQRFHLLDACTDR